MCLNPSANYAAPGNPVPGQLVSAKGKKLALPKEPLQFLQALIVSPAVTQLEAPDYFAAHAGRSSDSFESDATLHEELSSLTLNWPPKRPSEDISSHGLAKNCPCTITNEGFCWACGTASVPAIRLSEPVVDSRPPEPALLPPTPQMDLKLPILGHRTFPTYPMVARAKSEPFGGFDPSARVDAKLASLSLDRATTRPRKKVTFAPQAEVYETFSKEEYPRGMTRDAPRDLGAGIAEALNTIISGRAVDPEPISPDSELPNLREYW